MPEQDYAFNLSRIFLGNLPWFYVAEVLLRTTVMYFYALLLVRLLGKRGMGQLAPFDFVIIIALGSAVGDPMFYPDVPVLHGMAAITVVVVLTRLVGFLTERSRRFENLVEARPACLVRDGVMDLDAMESESIPRDELFQRLRTEGMEQLGQVDRAYIEPSGRVSVFRVPSDAPPRAGIPLVPQVEEDVVERFCAGGPVPTSGAYACWRCGHPVLLTEGSHFRSCPRCQGREWTRAVERVRQVLR
jgi:uncharacterized membrane protein YcaP (DUF421 family)/DNA-directed RNA polymerase subunit RPC12/RpoP